MRRIRVKRLLVSGLVYRLHIVVVESIALRILTGQWKWAIGVSIVLNVVSMLAYYNYHYWFARLFKLGTNSDSVAYRK